MSFRARRRLSLLEHLAVITRPKICIYIRELTGVCQERHKLLLLKEARVVGDGAAYCYTMMRNTQGDGHSKAVRPNYGRE